MFPVNVVRAAAVEWLQRKLYYYVYMLLNMGVTVSHFKVSNVGFCVCHEGNSILSDQDL